MHSSQETLERCTSSSFITSNTNTHSNRERSKKWKVPERPISPRNRFDWRWVNRASSAPWTFDTWRCHWDSEETCGCKIRARHGLHPTPPSAHPVQLYCVRWCRLRADWSYWVCCEEVEIKLHPGKNKVYYWLWREILSFRWALNKPIALIFSTHLCRHLVWAHSMSSFVAQT